MNEGRPKYNSRPGRGLTGGLLIAYLSQLGGCLMGSHCNSSGPYLVGMGRRGGAWGRKLPQSEYNVFIRLSLSPRNEGNYISPLLKTF